MKKIICLAAFFLAASTMGFAQSNLEDTVSEPTSQSRSANAGFAEEEFRRGVQSYYRGAFNEAILEFEKALSYLPGENLILEWLGKAYYRSGIEGAALQQWSYASESGYGGILLQNKIEIVSDRRITDKNEDILQRYTEAGIFPNTYGETVLYVRPTSILVNNDGTFWSTSYGSNEIILFDCNGKILQRYRGPLNGFDRPLDIMRLSNGKIVVSESFGDRLALLSSKGEFERYIGSKGLGNGQLMGPQYLAQDLNGNIFVTDFGNARVVVFDQEGTPLFTFGNKTYNFEGFKSPTGIVIIDDKVYVADSVKGSIYIFDLSGNYIGNLLNEHTLSRPESLESYGNYIVATDKNKVVTIDRFSGAVFNNATTGNGSSSITSATPDRNGNLIVTDYKANEIYVMSKMSELVGGLFVQIERVNADEFPLVTMDIRVENRTREQVIGLKEENFFVTENKRPVTNMQIAGIGNNNETVDLTIIIDRSKDMKGYEDQVTQAVRELAQAMNGKGRIQIISSGAIPNIEYTGTSDRLSTFSATALKNDFTDEAAFDLSVRLAANNLINAEKKRGIVYITNGSLSQNAFTQYGLSDTSAYLNNNAISFNTLMVSNSSMVEGLDYLTSNTTGESYYLYRPQGVSGIVTDMINIPSGLYQITYQSNLSTEYGKRYLPVEVETYMLNKSGRDECGYFAPLE